MYICYNHNGTFLGSFKTKKEAAKECAYYTSETGNYSYWEKECT
jgi:hypothetical protein